MKKLLQLKGRKCQQCGEFLAQFIEFNISPRWLEPDKVYYRFLCRMCKDEGDD